jgi:hypothetical protein
LGHHITKVFDHDGHNIEAVYHVRPLLIAARPGR